MKVFKIKTKTGNGACLHYTAWPEDEYAIIDKRILLPKEDDYEHFRDFFKPLRIGKKYILYQQEITFLIEDMKYIMASVIDLSKLEK